MRNDASGRVQRCINCACGNIKLRDRAVNVGCSSSGIGLGHHWCRAGAAYVPRAVVPARACHTCAPRSLVAGICTCIIPEHANERQSAILCAALPASGPL
jgi:hypothetical protein